MKYRAKVRKYGRLLILKKKQDNLHFLNLKSPLQHIFISEADLSTRVYGGLRVAQAKQWPRKTVKNYYSYAAKYYTEKTV